MVGSGVFGNRTPLTRSRKKIQNHASAVALHFMYYNFARVHQTLRITPAMAAGISDHMWEIEGIVALLDATYVPMKRGGIQEKGGLVIPSKS